MTFNEQLLDGLRPYQRNAINMTYDFMAKNPGGNPCIVMPTGSGKSWVIAGICENLMRRAPECKILVLTHRKELIEQDKDKIFKAWPEGRDRVGVVCAGLREGSVKQITVASIQTLARRLDQLNNDEGKIELTIIDEAHMIGKGNTTKQYKSVLDRVRELNPASRMIGLTATPYRLGQGRLDKGDGALFSTCIEPVSIRELVDKKYLVPLRSKFEVQFNLKGVRKQNGDYQINDLESRINTDSVNARIVSEAIEKGADRRAWLFFCITKNHAHAMCTELKTRGIHAKVLLGDTPREERAEILEQFRTGELQALTSVGVLTTGFDAPIIDMLVMARPTMSPGLYVQMAGRGMRLSPETGKTDCIMLDFAGLVAQHGPITRVNEPYLKTIVCPKCKEIICADEKICPACGEEISRDRKLKSESELTGESQEHERRGPSGTRHNDDVMGADVHGLSMDVRSWKWTATTTKKGANALIITYYPQDLTAKPVTVWLNLCHEDEWVRNESLRMLHALTYKIGVEAISNVGKIVLGAMHRRMTLEDLTRIAAIFNTNKIHPTSIDYDIKNGFPKITNIHWPAPEPASAVSTPPVQAQPPRPVAQPVAQNDDCGIARVTKDFERLLRGELIIHRDYEKEGDYHGQIAR